MQGAEVVARIERITATANWNIALGEVLEIDTAANDHPRSEETVGAIFDLVVEAIRAEEGGAATADRQRRTHYGQYATDFISLARSPQAIRAAFTRAERLLPYVEETLARPAAGTEADTANLVFRTLAGLRGIHASSPLSEIFAQLPRRVAQIIMTVEQQLIRSEVPNSNDPNGYLDRCKWRRSSNRPTYLPGDLLFRDLNVPKYLRFGPRFQHFGHAAIYLGPPSYDRSAPLPDHEIIEMTRAGCVISDLSSFMSGGFWGAYTVDPDDKQRIAIVTEALSYVGVAAYRLFGANYKNHTGRMFRCDGFVEHCYENLGQLGMLPPSLAHRDGLFEDDTYFNLCPAGLRNATFRKL